MDPTLYDPYFGDTIVISGAQLNTPLNLLKLIQAIAPNFNSIPSKLNIYADDGNAAPVLIGSSRVSATNYGTPLVPGANTNYQSQQTAPIGRIFLWCTANTTLHVEAYL